MKKTAVILAAALFAISVPITSFATMEHEQGDMPMDHGSMKMEHVGGMMAMGKTAHDEVVDGVRATFNVIDIKAKMKEMGMKETHHIMVVLSDPKSGDKLSEAAVIVKVMGPDKKEQVKQLLGMEGGFGSDFTMPEKGKYGVMAKFKLKDGKVRSVKFWYTVK
jgi:hypothetical protein